MTNHLSVFVDYSILIVLNILICGLIFGICICRLGKLKDALWRVKSQYAFLLVGSAAHGGAPIFFDQIPVGASVMFVATVLYMLVADTFQWKAGAPESTTDFGALHNVK